MGSELGILIRKSSQDDFYYAAKCEKHCTVQDIQKWVDRGVTKGLDIMPHKRQLKRKNKSFSPD